MEQRRAMRRDKLMAAGLQLYGTEGYNAGTVARVCALANLSTRQFYEEFASRDDLLFALYDRGQEISGRFLAEAWAEAPAREYTRDLIHRNIAAYVDSFIDDPRWATLLFVTVIGVSPELEAHRRRTRENWIGVQCAIAEELVRQGRIPHREFRPIVVAFVGAIDGLVYDWCHTLPRPARETITDTLTHMLFHAINAP
ncbi:TetR/AcrR family transcriptional regulator [Nocardia nova]|nr:TetR/AcrR family transcriptional regulator [Nocardia nova]